MGHFKWCPLVPALANVVLSLSHLISEHVLTGQVNPPHIAYACIGIFCVLFSLASFFVKEKLYIGEATVAFIVGLVLGPHFLNWFNPLSWGNVDYITLEICRVVLCIQIVAVAVELPRKYMKKHWISVAILLVPVMTAGWLVVGLFIWVLIPNFDFPSALLVSACVTATDPVLAAAVVGKGKFAERVPGHLRNLLTAESGCNDGMAFPFIFLSLYLITYAGQPGEILKHWFTLTILWQCIFGAILGAAIGYLLRTALFYAEKWNLIDRESFLALFVFLALICAGVGTMLGVDDLLVSFAAGTAFGWNGDFAKKTEESHVSTVIDLLLNLTFFVYFGSIIPWNDFNNSALGLEVWRLIILAVVIIFLRRFPAVMALKPVTPDIKSWREALFCGHFGPIGVGAIFAAILARKELEAHYSVEETPLPYLPDPNFPHYQLIAAIWPTVCFIVITSIIVHGSSVAVLALGRRLNRMVLTISLTGTATQDQGLSWMSRLQKLEHMSTLFSLHRIDSEYMEDDVAGASDIQRSTIDTSGLKVRPVGGAHRKRLKKKEFKIKSAHDEDAAAAAVARQRPATEFLQLGRVESQVGDVEEDHSGDTLTMSSGANAVSEKESRSAEMQRERVESRTGGLEGLSVETTIAVARGLLQHEELVKKARTIYEDGLNIIIEDAHGEVLDVMTAESHDDDAAHDALENSIHSISSLKPHMSNYSVLSDKSAPGDGGQVAGVRKTLVEKNRRVQGKRYFAHQFDDTLLIENEEGEIVRNYRLNRHSSGKPARSGLLMQRALLKVGLKKMDHEGSVDASGTSQQPSVGSMGARARPDADGDVRIAQRRDEFQSGTGLQKSISLETGCFEEEKKETEVERRRRMAALGKIVDSRDAEDEEH